MIGCQTGPFRDPARVTRKSLIKGAGERRGVTREEIRRNIKKQLSQVVQVQWDSKDPDHLINFLFSFSLDIKA